MLGTNNFLFMSELRGPGPGGERVKWAHFKSQFHFPNISYFFFKVRLRSKLRGRLTLVVPGLLKI